MHPLLKFVEQVLYVIITYTTFTRLAWLVHLDLLTDLNDLVAYLRFRGSRFLEQVALDGPFFFGSIPIFS